MRISDWSSDVCSSDLKASCLSGIDRGASIPLRQDAFFTNPWAEGRVADGSYVGLQYSLIDARTQLDASDQGTTMGSLLDGRQADFVSSGFGPLMDWATRRTSGHTSELHILMRTSNARLSLITKRSHHTNTH